jgi:hypothetical protein
MTEVNEEWMKKQKVYCESQLTCFGGQTVHVASGRARQVTTDLTPIVGTNAVAFDPAVDSVLSGVTLQVTPQLIPGSETAILDVQTTASEAGPAENPIRADGISATEPSVKAQISGAVDRVSMISQEMKTTARVPLRKKVIVGGMTLDPSNAEEAGRQLYLVVEIDAVK